MLVYMLDTDTSIYVINNRPPHVYEVFSRHEQRICISAITLGELISGADNSQNKPKTYAKLEGFVSNLVVLEYTEHAAMHYGQIKAALKRAGNIIGDNDMHIAAHARSSGLVVVTNNTREFSRVDGLRLENWLDEN